MARRSNRGDHVLDSRHLIGLFVGVVILCAVFFTLGYVMGRSHLSAAVQADTGAIVAAVDRERVQPKSKKDQNLAPEPEWDFYANQSNNHLEKPEPAPAPASAPAPKKSAPEKSVLAANTYQDDFLGGGPRSAAAPRASTRPVKMVSPKITGNSVLLQVAAVTHQGDAMAMAEALQRKKFPSFVIPPSGDGFYRVQVGPYPDDRSAENAKAALDRAGFKAIIKH
jgi:cell division septation protein DedD